MTKTAPPIDELFRSVVVFLNDGDGTDAIVQFIGELSDWIVRFDDWWKQRAGIYDGRNLHLLYGRNLSVISNDFICAPEAMISLLRAASGRGLAVILRTSLDNSLRYRSTLLDIVAAGVHTIIFDARDHEAPRNYDGAAITLIKELSARKLTIGLMGSVAIWRDLGIIDSGVLDSGNFQIIPASSKETIADITNGSRHAGRERDAPVARIPSIDPCWHRLQVFVAQDGRLYPCNALIGVEHFAFGTIRDDLSETHLGGRTPYKLALGELALRGPDIPALVLPSVDSELPAVCIRHRSSLEEAHRRENKPATS